MQYRGEYLLSGLLEVQHEVKDAEVIRYERHFLFAGLSLHQQAKSTGKKAIWSYYVLT